MVRKPDVTKIHPSKVEPHPFEPRGWRRWICRHCYAPKTLHPRRSWTIARPLTDNQYLSANAPHFKGEW
jgi:hypothetical protein